MSGRMSMQGALRRMSAGNQARIWHIMVIFDLSHGSARLAIASGGEAREIGSPSKLGNPTGRIG